MRGFTLIELILAIVIIGVLAAVAVPQFRGLSDNAKISSELSTAASVQAALDACHGEWIVNECDFVCGIDISSVTDLNPQGYPLALGDKLQRILKGGGTTKFVRTSGSDGDAIQQYEGPASDSTKGVSKCKPDKPCKTRYWEYNATGGTFSLK